MKRFLPLLILFTAPLLMCAANFEQTLDSGHRGPAHTLAWDEERGLLFSGGQDGSLRIWQSEPFRLLRKIQLSELPVRQLRLNPRAEEIALVQSDSNNRHILSVLNWKTNQVQFTADLPRLPLVLEFSPLGSFVVVAKTDWNSLTFFDARNGKNLNPLREGFGIVSFLLISSSENTLVSYTPSTGTFIYWDLKTGTQKQTVRGVQELKNLRVYSARYAVGTLGEELVVVDLVTGALAASASEREILDLTVSPQGEIISLSRDVQGSRLQKWSFQPPGPWYSKGILYRSDAPPRLLPGEPADLVAGSGGIFAAQRDGSIALAPGDYSPVKIMGQNRLAPVTDLIGDEGVLRLVTRDKIYSFQSDLFLPDTKPENAQRLSVNILENPLKAPSGILKTDRGDHFLWIREANTPGKIARIDFNSGVLISRFDSFDLPLSAVRESEGFLYCLERNGSIKKINSAGMELSFEYPAWGLHTMVPLENRNILAGKSSAGLFSSPLVSINAQTGETVSLDTPPLQLVFALDYDSRSRLLYFAGLEQTAAGETLTKLFRASPDRVKNAVGFALTRGLDIDAVIHIDTVGQDLYTNLGKTLRGWNGSRWRDFEPGNAVPVLIRDQGSLLYGINSEGSVSVWEKKSGRLVGTIYVLDDGHWIMVARSGQFLTSYPEWMKPPLTALESDRILSAEEQRELRLFLLD